MLSNQTNNPQPNKSARMLNDNADKLMLTYVLWHSVREQNNRKLQEHLKMLVKIRG